MIKHVCRNDDLGEPVAVTSTSKLSLIAGRYVGKDDPIMMVRCQSGLPAVGEMLEAIRWAARRLRTAPEELRVTSCRSVRVQRRAMPAETAITAPFGSWMRARERAAISTKRAS